MCCGAAQDSLRREAAVAWVEEAEAVTRFAPLVMAVARFAPLVMTVNVLYDHNLSHSSNGHKNISIYKYI